MYPLGGTGEATQQCVASSKLLIGLPEGTPWVKYTNINKLKNIVDTQCRDCCADSSKSPFLIVTCVSDTDTFLRDFEKAYPDKGPHITCNLQENPVIILEVMTHLAHELATSRLQHFTEARITQMSLEDQLIAINQPEITSSNGAWKKIPDLGYALIGDLEWPVLVIETGLSETKEKLAIDAQGWLEAHGSRTQVVITIKIDQRSPYLTIQRWEHYPLSRPITRSFQLSGSIQTVEIIHKNGITRATGELTIPFYKVFRRAKHGRGETDIIIERHELIKVAEFVWRAQGFM
ncbi:hypothetical protein McanMca71_004492 [Microsporum canis]|uniref:Uncharacterized protein n=1 Tax=Arthroderma otae (strain ATCC MYA-4605 / CBS 113480) TaxID=554155 RepID=C5FP80_ARTOC|nr:conserved hypothetical protein [Microsporum canis CBS 113480]EEQ31396.1 conserved hypothetical protein [Microsporum canis CBS 113480]